MLKKTVFITITIIVLALLALAIRGNRGEPVSYQSGYDRRVGGPFESSNSSARYALVESIVENKTFELDEQKAQFASPDVVETKGKFYSIFTPGVSFLAVPFYIVGRYFGFPQLGAYSSILLFALVNFFLTAFLAKKLGATYWGSLLAGFTFTFATNALAYSQTLTQHHMSTTAILLGLIIASGKTNVLKNLAFGFLAGVALLLDVPALILMIPIGLYILSRNISVNKVSEKLRLSIKWGITGLIIGITPLIILFGLYNFHTTGSYTTLAQSIGRTDAFSVPTARDTKEEAEKKIDASASATLGRGGIELPFDTREQIKGFYILLISNERAWVYYSPVVFLGVLGLVLAIKKGKKSTLAAIAVSVVLLNVVLYSMFGDPWGGWAFGPRYLIPAAAVLCAALPLVFKLIHFKASNYIVGGVFVVLFVYSASVSTLGALTTNAIPPKVEAINFSQPIPYTYDYNLQLIQKNQASALFYNLYFSPYLLAQNYVLFYIIATSIVGVALVFPTALTKKS